ncbi:MAG: NAD(P)/FAD-dependent oxidoreductase [Acidobacteria bacterium]|nr:NAD(P)/FAD-dependent oxidoreductase [Acidobacteriota bacterium]MBW4044484.1 NAD(P)/FAD-dependent oxidoreductase [Acidobacteriota bacterium]
MCAMEAGSRGKTVAVLDHADQPGRKILISGGGRANFTNLHCRPDNFLSSNPHFAKSALARFTPEDFLALVRKHRIPFHEKKLGQLFCDRSARDLLDMLLAECAEAGVQLFLGSSLSEITRPDGFHIRTSRQTFTAPALVVAAGGLSIPKIGATGIGYDIARQFGIKVIEPRAALVPLTFSARDLAQFQELSGVSTEVTASVEGQAFREKMLFTHRGLSGPAILQISSYWRQGGAIEIDFAPGEELFAPLRGRNARRDPASAEAALRSVLPQRLAARLIETAPPTGWTNAALDEAETRLHHWRFLPAGTEGFSKAEVTAGGVDTDALSARTMESRAVPGLYFIGEVVDVTGHLGGFNFQWAWASGAAAGRAL